MTPIWDKRVAPWVASKIEGCERGFDAFVSMGVIHKRKLVAGLVFHNWEPEHGLIEVSAAATDRRWLTRKVINEALRYAFEEAGCQMVVARQAVENTPARKVWLALGGQEYIIPRLRGRTKDGSIITLTDTAWRQSKFYEAH